MIAKQSTHGSATDCLTDFSTLRVERRHVNSSVQSASVVCGINNTSVVCTQLVAFSGAREDRFIFECLVSLSHMGFFERKKVKFSFVMCIGK